MSQSLPVNRLTLIKRVSMTWCPRYAGLRLNCVSAWALFVGIALGLGACTTPEPGVSNTVANSQQLTVDKPITQAGQAVIGAYKQLQIGQINRRASKRVMQISGKTESNTSVNTRLTRLGEHQTRLTVRVGTLGDKALGVAVMRQIKVQVRRQGDTATRP